MGITRAADGRVDVVDVRRVELGRGEASRCGDDEPRGPDGVGVRVVEFARPDFGEEDLRDCPLAVCFGLLAFMLAS